MAVPKMPMPIMYGAPPKAKAVGAVPKGRGARAKAKVFAAKAKAVAAPQPVMTAEDLQAQIDIAYRHRVEALGRQNEFLAMTIAQQANQAKSIPCVGHVCRMRTRFRMHADAGMSGEMTMLRSVMEMVLRDTRYVIKNHLKVNPKMDE